MMYDNKLVAVVKVNGKILRESNSTVYIPFGSEYSILIKNLNNSKAVVSVSIDETDVLNGSRIIVDPLSSVELEGFLKGNSVTNKFKFIEKTDEISEFRGDNIEDGLVRITWQFEKIWTYDMFTPLCNTYYGSNGTYRSFDPPLSSEPYSTVSCSCNSLSCNIQNDNEDGITVRGGKSDQQFTYGRVNTLENIKHSMVIQLKGTKKEERIISPITVKTKVQCDTCGRKWKSTFEFCGNCGTSLR